MPPSSFRGFTQPKGSPPNPDLRPIEADLGVGALARRKVLTSRSIGF
jgi:hypothetical protein